MSPHGSENGANKIHWAKWSNLCMPKCSGGMGFKDMECFNRSLLAKQGWRIISKPECLLSRIFKLRYFKDGTFLEAGCPRSASYTWKSIIWSREVINKSSRWRVGDGASIQIYKDRWLPREKTFKVLSQNLLGEKAMVSELITGPGQWNLDLLCASFIPEDVHCITSIPLSNSRQADHLRWHYDKNGSYTVRSGYRVAVEMKELSMGSDTSGLLRWWKFLWSLNISSKVKIFLWRCYHNWLPVRVNLIHRGMSVQPNCPLCNEEEETVIHSLWFCKRAKEVWQAWNKFEVIETNRSWNMQDLIYYAYTKLHKSDFVIFGVLLWLLWNNRNCIVFGKMCKPVKTLLEWSITYVEDFQAASSKVSGMNIVQEKQPGDGRWVPPKDGVFTVNVDAAFDDRNRMFSSGAIIRDSKGMVQVAANRRYKAIPEVATGEACAVRDGISLALESNLIPFQICSDSKVVIDVFNSKSMPCNDVSLIAEDCRSMIVNNICNGFSYVRRSANRAADALAKLAFRGQVDFSIWMGSIPPEINDFVMADISACSA